MEELMCVLRTHVRRYPKMEPTDAVKLIYQNEFGGGHMIRDEESCLAYLHAEYARTPRSAAAQLCEDIGNGLVRVHLAALAPEMLAVLGHAFIRSAAAQKGSAAQFESKLAILRQLCAEGIFSFGTEALEQYLVAYERAGYPAVSHSRTYRDAYHPAYRIVKKELFL